MATPERRVRRCRVERRDADGGKAGGATIVGHAAVWDQWTTLYEGRYWRWREVIRPGAFSNAIAEKQDVRSLFNHDPNFILGRTKSGTLTLAEDETGLLSTTNPPDSQTVRDLVLMPMDRGDVDGMSFAFSIRRGDGKVVRTEDADGKVVIVAGGQRITCYYDGDCEVEDREVLDADLYDTSPVVYPQYEGTDVALRSVAEAVAARAKEMDQPRERRRSPWLAKAWVRLRCAEAGV